MHDVATIVGRSSYTNFKWAWNGGEFELFALITSNKNEREFTKNVKAMTRATRAQLPRYVVSMINLKEMRPTLPKKTGEKSTNALGKPRATLKNLALRAS
jgi:hypothetical protein